MAGAAGLKELADLCWREGPSDRYLDFVDAAIEEETAIVLRAGCIS
jgi:hypothetical protein